MSMLRGLRISSTLSVRPLVSGSKGKASLRPPRFHDHQGIGCSYWSWGIRPYISVPSDARHDVEVGLLEDSDKPKDNVAPLEPLETVEEDDARADTEDSDQGNPLRPRLPTSQKKLNRLLSRHVMHEIPEHELSEQFVKGSGPGGQAINKTNSAVHLLHIPTGIRIRAQPSRLRGKNREAARKILGSKLDDLRARGLYPVKDGKSVAEEIIIDPETNLEPHKTSVEGGEEADKKLDKKARKEAKKAEEISLSAAYSQSELRAHKIRTRKVKKAKKAKKKKRDKDAADAEGEEE